MADGTITRRGVCGGALAAIAGSAVAVPMLVEAQGSDDRRVLELLLLIERTEAAFYAAALDADILDGELAEFANVVRGHEAEHLAVVEGALGDDLPAEPTFDFGENLASASAFAEAAAKLEDAAVGAYNGQAANVSTKIFTVAARIVSVEARHAAWVRSIEDRDPAPDATDKPMTEQQVRDNLRELGVTE
jgi:Ferritin-like domain